MKTYSSNGVKYYYAPFYPDSPMSNLTIVNKTTRKPICVIDIPYDEVPNDKNFHARVKRIVEKELQWKNINTLSTKTT